ncbi:MAG: twin-arginine translocation signal domain-containing protein [Chloroflexi bacterium]|nr:twin-arginine translocation signal domain-containing protein [Chloroflexota bacterium]
MINRRDFLKVGGAVLAGGLVSAKFNPVQAAEAESVSLIQGVNLQGWTLAKGDAECPDGAVNDNDIKTIHQTGYSELRANVLKRAIMAHNITYKKVINPALLNYFHSCSVLFRLPYLPQQDTSATTNGQTVECGIFVWDGPNTRRDYGMAFQWLINPWGDQEDPQGTIRVWNGTGWIHVGQKPVDTQWHTLKMAVDLKRKTTLLTIDNKFYPSQYSITTKSPTWGTTVDARFQVEAVSINPCPDNIMKAMHRVQYKNWKWLWEAV